MKGEEITRAALRLLKRLAARITRLIADESGGFSLHDGSAARTLDGAEYAAVIHLRSEGLIAAAADGRFVPTDLGRRMLVRHLAGADGFAAQHQDRATEVLNDPDLGTISVTVNHDESPLSWLRRRRGRDGKPMVSAAEFTAGERLRNDFERGNLQPRITANWTASISVGRRSGGGGAVELTDAAMAARQRVDALRAVDQEFAGVLLDVCCFLKGIEDMERGHGLPSRTGKVLIRLGLARLARHYGLSPRADGPDWSRRLVHWGTDDYRPRIDG